MFKYFGYIQICLQFHKASVVLFTICNSITCSPWKHYVGFVFHHFILLQEALPNSPSSITGVNGVSISLEKSRNDEHLSGRSRGWLNWLSRGMLGAGGTDDSAQFSGVVSDEVVKVAVHGCGWLTVIP